MPGTSTNRDRAAPFRGAERHYFRTSTRLASLRGRLCALALLLSLGWIALGFVREDRRYDNVTHGPLADPNAMLNSRCDACHIPYGEAGNTSSSPIECRERWRAFRSESCHRGPTGDPKNYSPHYALGGPWPDDPHARDCSSCHHDHQGKDFSLVRVSDAACVRCHRDLSAMHTGLEWSGHSVTGRQGTGPPLSGHGVTGPLPSVTYFPKEHPNFRVLASPPKRGLKFNHGLHLAAGISSVENPNARFKLDDIDPRFREQFKPFARADGTIQLNCTACHQLQPSGKLGLPASGAYYQPIVFEKHCQACHTQMATNLASKNGVPIKEFELPHRVQPADVERAIRAEVARQITAKSDLLLKTPLPPSDRLDTPRPIELPANLHSEMEKLAEQYSRLAFDRGGNLCLKCHSATFEGSKPLAIEPTLTRAVWLPAARFDHAKHRTFDCAGCHRMWNEPGDAKRLTADTPPFAANLPSIDTCRKCHSESYSTPKTTLGGAKHSCVDCHRYHGGARRP